MRLKYKTVKYEKINKIKTVLFDSVKHESNLCLDQ
jgi:hypothetical protein